MNSDTAFLSKQFLFLFEEDREHYVNKSLSSYKNVSVCIFESFDHDVSDYEVKESALAMEYTDVIEGQKTMRENISSRKLKQVFQVIRDVPFDPDVDEVAPSPEVAQDEVLQVEQEREPGEIRHNIKPKHAHCRYLFLYHESVEYTVDASFGCYENRHRIMFQNLPNDIDDDAIETLAKSHAWQNHHGHVMSASCHHSSRILSKIVQLGRELDVR